MIMHSLELLNLAVSPIKSKEAVRALQILTAANRDICSKLVKGDMNSVADRVLVSDVDMVTLSRFTEICQSVALVDPAQFFDSCVFVQKLYDWIGFQPVYMMFECILNGTERPVSPVAQKEIIEKSNYIRDILAENGFVEKICEERDDLNSIENSFRLMTLAAKGTGKLCEKIKCAEMIERFMQDRTVKSLQVMDAKMDTLNAILCEETSEFIVPYFEYFVSLLEIDQTERFHIYQNTSLDMITKLVKFQCEKVCPYLVEHKFEETVNELLENFYGNSNLQGRIRALVMESLAAGGWRDALLSKVLPTYRVRFVEQKPYWIHSWKMFRKLQKQFEKQEGLKDFVSSVIEWNEEFENEIAHYEQIKKNPYGGELPDKLTLPADLQALDPAKLMLLLKLLRDKEQMTVGRCQVMKK